VPNGSLAKNQKRQTIIDPFTAKKRSVWRGTALFFLWKSHWNCSFINDFKSLHLQNA
jgi:hypothetical protein